MADSSFGFGFGEFVEPANGVCAVRYWGRRVITGNQTVGWLMTHEWYGWKKRDSINTVRAGGSSRRNDVYHGEDVIAEG